MTTHTATLRAEWNGVPKGTRLRILARENLRGIPVAYVAREDDARLPSPHGGTERYARIGLDFLAMDKEYRAVSGTPVRDEALRLLRREYSIHPVGKDREWFRRPCSMASLRVIIRSILMAVLSQYEENPAYTKKGKEG